MKLVYSKFLAHTRTKPNSYEYDYQEDLPSVYGKSTRFSFKHPVSKSLHEELLKPNRAWSCAVVDKGDKFKSGKYDYVFKTDNILVINGFMPIDLDDVTQDEVDNSLAILKDKQVEFYALHSQNSSINKLKIKLLINTGLHFISDRGEEYIEEASDEDKAEIIEPEYTYYPLSKYKSAYRAVAESIGIAVQMDSSSIDPARLIAPFHDPHKQDLPLMYEYNTPEQAYSFEEEIEVDKLTEDVPTVTTHSEVYDYTIDKSVVLKDIISNKEQDYSTNINYSIDININNTQKKVSLAEAALLKSKGYNFQVSCLCNKVHEHGHMSNTNIGYGILSDYGNNNYHITCSSPNHSPIKTVHYSLVSDRELENVEACNTEKYIRVNSKLVISKETGKYHKLKTKLLYSKHLVTFTSGLINMAAVTEACNRLMYFTTNNNSFSRFKLKDDLNTKDFITDREVLDILEATYGFKWYDTQIIEGKEIVPFDIKKFKSALIHFIKDNCFRIDKVENKVSNKYDEADVIVGNTLIKYRKFTPITVPDKPEFSEEAWEHFTSVHTELPAMLHNLAVWSNLEHNERTGERFYFYFGSGGIGKGIINQALLSCGAGIPISNATIETLSGTSTDVKIAESPEDLSTHMIAICSDSKIPRKILASAKMLTDTFVARNNYKNGEQVNLCSLVIMAADNISVKEFFNGADSKQIFRRFRVPYINNLDKSLLSRAKPKHITNWNENSVELNLYVKGVEYYIAKTLKEAIDNKVKEVKVVNELINREEVMKNSENILPSIILDMMSNTIDKYEPDLVGGKIKSLKVESLSKAIGITTKGKMVLSNKAFKVYGSLQTEQEFILNTQQSYLDKYLYSKSSSANIFYLGVNNSEKFRYYKTMPIDILAYFRGKEKVMPLDMPKNVKENILAKSSNELYDVMLNILKSEKAFETKSILIGHLMGLYHNKILDESVVDEEEEFVQVEENSWEEFL